MNDITLVPDLDLFLQKLLGVIGWNDIEIIYKDPFSVELYALDDFLMFDIRKDNTIIRVKLEDEYGYSDEYIADLNLEDDYSLILNVSSMYRVYKNYNYALELIGDEYYFKSVDFTNKIVTITDEITTIVLTPTRTRITNVETGLDKYINMNEDLSDYIDNRDCSIDFGAIRCIALLHNKTIVAVRFKTEKGAYDIKIDKAKELGLRTAPTRYIRVDKEGSLLISEKEKQNKALIPDITNNTALVKSLLQAYEAYNDKIEDIT